MIAPVLLFTIYQRFPDRTASPREKKSVYWMNLAILGIAVSMSALMGWQSYLVIQLFITAVGSGTGIWMFYVQHQFDDTHWENAEEWDYATAALHGSSFYKLPQLNPPACATQITSSSIYRRNLCFPALAGFHKSIR